MPKGRDRMWGDHLLRQLGNRRAIDNAREASTELSRRRVEREDVELYLERLHAPSSRTLARYGDVAVRT